MTPENIFNTLEDLGDEEFCKFKWFLQQADSLQGLPAVKKSRLQAANRWDTVDLMVHTYRLPGAVEVTRRVLERINRNDLLQSFSAISSGPEGQSQEEKLIKLLTHTLESFLENSLYQFNPHKLPFSGCLGCSGVSREQRTFILSVTGSSSSD